MTDDTTPRTDPAPADVWERLDYQRICAGLVAHMTAPDRVALEAGRLRWSLDGFDELGMANAEVMTLDGEPVMSLLVHWSAVVADG